MQIKIILLMECYYNLAYAHHACIGLGHNVPAQQYT